jgi:hypothetical protein
LGETPAVAVFHTSNPVAGDVTGPAVFVAVRATLGRINPLLLFAERSRIDDAFGLVPLVLMETPFWAFEVSKKDVDTRVRNIKYARCNIRASFYKYKYTPSCKTLEKL